MTVRLSFINLCAVYYVIQLVRCVLISFAAAGVILFLRSTLLKNRVFLKSALWSLLLPVLFVGKMKFFYEHTIGVLLFTWWNTILANHLWISRLYLTVVILYAAHLIHQKRKLKKLTAGMEKRNVEGTIVYVAKMPVTPSTIGIFKPRIVMPEVMLKEYNSTELQTILLHEKTHIRLGHLFFYFLWDVLRVLLWLNPLLAIGTKYFREDMEELCDFVTIQNSNGTTYDYGQLLLKSMKVLQAESDVFNMYATFAGNAEYKSIRQRITRITGYRRYSPAAAAGLLAAASVCVTGSIVWVQSNSYGRYNENDVMFTYGYDGGTVTFFDDSDGLRQMITYDDSFVYVNREAFDSYLLENHAAGDIFIVFGGFYKLPGFGGAGCSCAYETGSKEQVVVIPYDSPLNDWRVRLLQII